MAEDKNINLMPEDLRKKEDLVKKSNWSFVPDLSSPGKTKEVKKSQASGSAPSWLSKMLKSLAPAPRVKTKPVVEIKKEPVSLAPEPQPTIKSPIYTAPDLKPIPVKPIQSNEKVEEHIQDWVSQQALKSSQAKAHGPSWWQKFLAWFKPKPKAPKKPAPIKEEKATESILAQAVKRNGYKVDSDAKAMSVAPKIVASDLKQDFKNLNSAEKVEDILDIKAKPELIKPEPVLAEIPLSPKKIEEKIPDATDFVMPSVMAPLDQETKKPEPVVTKVNGKFHQPEIGVKGRLTGELGGVDLIPVAARIRSWRQIGGLFFLATLASIIILAVFYGALFLQEQAIAKEYKLQQQAMLAIEKEILNFNDLNKNIQSLSTEIDLVQNALNRHIYWTKFFALLEKYTLPEVYYGGIAAGNNGALTLTASSENYESVARQLKVLQQESAKEFVQSVAINSATMNDQGVGFSINLVLNPDLFYYDK